MWSQSRKAEGSTFWSKTIPHKKISMTEKLRSIGEVLSSPSAFKWGDALYADPAGLADFLSPCLVLDPECVETDKDDEPVEARERGFSYVLSIQDIQSIYANLEPKELQRLPNRCSQLFSTM